MTFRSAKVKDPFMCPRCGKNPREKKKGWCKPCVKAYNDDYHKKNPRGYGGRHKTRFKKLEMEVMIRVLSVVVDSPFAGLMNREEREALGSSLKKMKGKEANV